MEELQSNRLDLDRARALWPDAELLEPAAHRVVFYSSEAEGGYEELKADVIISFNGMCLVRAAGETAWWMGQLHGRIDCLLGPVWGGPGESDKGPLARERYPSLPTLGEAR